MLTVPSSLQDYFYYYYYYYYYAAFNAPCVGHKDDESQAWEGRSKIRDAMAQTT